MKNWLTKQKTKKIGPYLLLFCLCLLFTSPIFQSPYNTGVKDWDEFFFYSAAPRKILVEYGQIPLWNPYYMGGMPIQANPQVGALRPTFPLVLLLGTPLGMKAELLLFTFLGAMGFFLLVREWKVDLLPAFVGTSIFTFSSYFSLHLAEGHANRMNFYLLPLAFLCYYRAQDRKSFSYTLGGSLIMMAIVLGGGTGHVLVPLALFLGVYSIFQAIKSKSFVPLQYLLLMGVMAGGLAAVKLLPMVDYIVDHPRHIQSRDFLPLASLGDVFLSRDQSLRLAPFSDRYGWHEYGAYTGWLPLLFFGGGLFVIFRRHYPLILTGIFFFLLSLGNISPFAPWPWLHSLPVFDNTRVPSRNLVFFIFVLALVNSFLWQKIIGWIKNKKHRWAKYLYLLACLVAALVVFDLLVVNHRPYTQAFPHSPQKVQARKEFRQFIDRDPRRSGAISSMFYNLQANLGTLNGYEYLPVEVNALGIYHPRYQGEIFLTGPGRAKYTYWSPCRLVARIKTDEANLAVINQNYHPGWKLEGPGKIVNYKGRLAVIITPEVKKIELSFWPSSFLRGVSITILTLFSLIFFSLYHYRKKLWKKSPSS